MRDTFLRVAFFILSSPVEPNPANDRSALPYGTGLVYFASKGMLVAPRDENISRLQLRLMVLINRNFDFNVFSVFNKLKTLRNGTTLRFNLILKNWLEVTFKNFENYTSLFFVNLI